MHYQYWPLQVIVPKNTPASAPYSQSWPIVQGHMRDLRVQIPPGHNGRTGLRVKYMGTQVMPWVAGLWLVGSGDVFTIPWADEVMATGWAVEAYNVDTTSHNFYLYAAVMPTVEPAQASLLNRLFSSPAAQQHHAAVSGLASHVQPGGKRV